MSKKKPKKKRKTTFTPINKQRRLGSELTTPLSDMDIEAIDWERDLMPEHIWIDLLANEYEKLDWAVIYNDFCDRIDAVLEEERKLPFLGFISDFGMLTASERRNFIEHNKDFAYQFFFNPVGKILSLYPDSPANWLVLEEWKKKVEINFETELKRLARSLSRLIKGKDLYTGHIRAIPLNRLFKHNKLLFAKEKFDDLLKLLEKYPGGCSEEEKYRVQQRARLIIDMDFMISDRYKQHKWPKYFWRHNYDLAPCIPMSRSLADGEIVDEEKIKELQSRLFDNSLILIEYLDKISIQYKYDLYNPLFDEIKLGLFSRIIRLYISFISNPGLWSRDFSGIILRCIGETAIILFYLAKKGTKEEFQKFKDYSLGKEKLLMLNMQDTLQERATIEGKSIEDISEEMGGEFIAEMQKIELKNWTKKNIRKLSQEVGLDDIYKWVIDPTSAEIHGSWSSLKKSNLVFCRQILHRFHRIPRFYDPPILLIPMYVATRIYQMCEDLAIHELGCPSPDEQLKEISELSEAYNKISNEVETDVP